MPTGTIQTRTSTRSAAARVAVCAVALASASFTSGQPATGPATTQPATTQAAATRPVDAGVAALIRQLGADDESDRTDAQRQLVDLGTTVTDALRQAADHDADPEVRSRSAAALAQIRDRDANGPTLVTIHARDADLATVLGQLGDQAHAEIAQRYAAVRGGPTVTVDADRRPFWDVLADVCGQANVCPLPLLETPNRNRLELYATPRNWIARGPHQVVGPFCIGVSGLYRMASVDLSGPPVSDDTFFARLIVFPEPKLVVTQISPLTVREATDDAGNSLVLPAAGAAARLLGRMASRVPARTVEARLRYPSDHPGKRVATLAGDLLVTLAQGAQRFEADDVMGRATVTRPLPGVRVRVAVARQPTGIYYPVTVECVRDGLPDPQWYAMTNRVGDLSVEDAAGHALSPMTSWVADSANSDTVFKATATFARTAAGNLLINRMAAAAGGGNNVAAAAAVPAPGEPARIVWNVAARFKVVTVPVAFHDLPMP